MSQKFGILAYPAAHSLSPVMHMVAFQECGIDANYDFFEIPPKDLAQFLQRVRLEHIVGLSVSIPHKIKVMQFLDEIEESAQKIGAVNTIFWKDEKLVGTNTDWIGAIETLETVINLTDKKVVVLGGGGAARAIVFGLLEHKAIPVVITREEWEAVGIAKDFNVPYDLIENLNQYSPSILVNATPLGMKGEFENRSFVSPNFFQKNCPLVFDIVYNPAKTLLLKDAQAAGCQIIGGLEMLVRQGARQFEIWIQQPAPFDVMFAAAKKNL